MKPKRSKRGLSPFHPATGRLDFRPSSNAKHEVNEDEEDAEEEEDEEICREEVYAKSLSLSESVLVELNLELEDRTLTFTCNMNRSKRKYLTKLAKRNKPKLIRFFEKNSACLTVTYKDGTVKNYLNEKRMAELFSPYQSPMKDHGLEEVQSKPLKAKIIYA